MGLKMNKFTTFVKSGLRLDYCKPYKLETNWTVGSAKNISVLGGIENFDSSLKSK